jgi:hypothetical protein
MIEASKILVDSPAITGVFLFVVRDELHNFTPTESARLSPFTPRAKTFDAL